MIIRPVHLVAHPYYIHFFTKMLLSGWVLTYSHSTPTPSGINSLKISMFSLVLNCRYDLSMNK